MDRNKDRLLLKIEITFWIQKSQFFVVVVLFFYNKVVSHSSWYPSNSDLKKSQQGSDVLSFEMETQHWSTGHIYTLHSQQSIHTMGTFFG